MLEWVLMTNECMHAAGRACSRGRLRMPAAVGCPQVVLTVNTPGLCAPLWLESPHETI